MVKHVAYFDRPAHYLRVSILFDEPFWGEKIPGAWFMSEAFGGCCVYNEGARHDVGKHGVLNWLIAGSDALAFANLSDEELIDAALKSLPAAFGDAREHFLEGKIHRWLSSVNALPGGLPARDVMTNHRPEPKEHPGIVVVGDYLFDSTLNGLLDSSDAATDIILTEMMRLRRARAQAGSAAVRQDRPRLFRQLSRARPLQRGLEPVHRSRLPDGADQDRLGQGKGLQAPGRGLSQRRTGRRAARTRHRCLGHREQPRDPRQTPKALKKYNKLGSILDMPFKTAQFDFVFETSLCHVAEKQVARAVARIQPGGQDRAGVRLGDVGHGAGPDRPL